MQIELSKRELEIIDTALWRYKSALKARRKSEPQNIFRALQRTHLGELLDAIETLQNKLARAQDNP